MKTKKVMTAASGGSAVLFAAKQMPGGKHNRRPKPRGPQKRAAIREYS